MNTLETQNNKLTKQHFDEIIKNEKYLFSEYRLFEKNIYKIEYKNSFLKCAIQKTDVGVQIIYLDSFYEQKNDMILLIGYATFIIAYRENNNKMFNEIEFNNDGDITTIK